MEKYMLPCLNKQMFGLECPGCGMQRAVNFLLQGEFVSAFKIFPAIYTLAILFILLGLHLIDKSRNYTKAVIAAAIANGAVMIFFYIYRIVN